MSAGNIGIVSRSGTLTYQTAEILNRAGFGESTCLGIGGDPVGGLGFVDVLALFEKDPETKIVVMIGEIGGQGEEAAAAFIKKNMTKPVVTFVAGRSAPEGKTMGHAGAIISAGKGTYQSKAKAFEEAGVPVARIITDIPKLVKEKKLKKVDFVCEKRFRVGMAKPARSQTLKGVYESHEGG